MAKRNQKMYARDLRILLILQCLVTVAMSCHNFNSLCYLLYKIYTNFDFNFDLKTKKYLKYLNR